MNLNKEELKETLKEMIQTHELIFIPKVQQSGAVTLEILIDGELIEGRDC
jgi:hypothetical protein